MRAGAQALGFLLLTLAVGAVVAVAKKNSPPDQAQLVRGKYLVESVGLCGHCHTPNDEKGKPIKDQWMKGAAVFLKPAMPVPDWADKAPNIAGLRGWEEADAIKFLMTGIAFNGLPARPPMPQYRFNKEDAMAVVAYLRSGKPSGEEK